MVTVKDNKEHIRALLYSYCTMLPGEGSTGMITMMMAAFLTCKCVSGTSGTLAMG